MKPTCARALHVASRRSCKGGGPRHGGLLGRPCHCHIATLDRPSTVRVPVGSARAARGGAQQQGGHEAAPSSRPSRATLSTGFWRPITLPLGEALRRRWTKNGKTRHVGLWIDPAGAVGAVEAGVACVGGCSWCWRLVGRASGAYLYSIRPPACYATHCRCSQWRCARHSSWLDSLGVSVVRRLVATRCAGSLGLRS
jgi:hypothetical protein